ncbi:hypothetical protein MMC19_004051 [Ptychographa xylographoides]|nr:hypothetical protein [Ptychographa xylographoides]
MEAGAVAAFYAAETAVEGAVGATLAIARSTMPLKASFRRVPTEHLPRSSHSLDIIKGKAYIFGGEIQPRQPVDSSMHIFTLPSSGVVEADYQCVPAKARDSGHDTPAPRVGHSSAVIADRIYIFGGRGGPDMKPLEEGGRVWCFDTLSNAWFNLDPAFRTHLPEARSYHTSAATEHPLPSDQDHTINPVGSPDEKAHGTVFIHGGCPASGRTADVWAFDVAARMWSQYPDAPGPPRGGPSLTFTRDRLYRFGGFDGKNELGGEIDYLEIAKNLFNDKGGQGELSVFAKTGKWESVPFPSGLGGPGNRSVAGLQPITTGSGRNYLILFLGERDASSKGHEGAGKFWDDVWAFQLRPTGMTAASLKDATRFLVGAKSSEDTWAQVEIPEATMTEGQKEHPGERGWFACAQSQDFDAASVIIHGGVNGNNQRLGDCWVLTIDI